MMLGRPATETQITHGRRLWLYVLGAIVLLFLILPSLIIIPLSFSDSRYLAFPPPGWSTRWYEAYFGAAEWRDATRVSLVAATLTMAISTVLGTLAAYGLHTLPSRFMRVAYATFMLPLIIPGIEKAAPERTETSSGFLGSPNFFPTFSSIFCKPSLTWSHMPSGKLLSLSKKALQASVVTMSPGGTGKPARVISQSPAPLPPSSDLSSPLPSSKR